MSVKSQEHSMRRLAALLGQDLSYIGGDRESGSNGNKKTFLNVGKVFLRALARDLGLRDVTVSSTPGGIAVSGDCSMIGMWEDGGIYVCLHKPVYHRELVLCYRTARHSKDFKGGYNHYLTRNDLKKWSYGQLLDTLSELRKDGYTYERAA